MKTFLAAVICFLGVSVSLFSYMKYVDKSVDELCSMADKIEESIESDDWERAKDMIDGFKDKWESKKKKFGYFIDQKETEAVSETIEALYCYIESENKDEANVKINAAKLQLKQLSQRERPTLVNILKVG